MIRIIAAPGSLLPEILWDLADAVSFITALTSLVPDGGLHWARSEHTSFTIIFGVCYILPGIACRLKSKYLKANSAKFAWSVAEASTRAHCCSGWKTQGSTPNPLEYSCAW